MSRKRMKKEERSGSRAFANTSVTAIVGVGQLPAITGSELAAASSNHFGRKVVFERLQPKEFGKLLAPLFEGERLPRSWLGTMPRIKLPTPRWT